MIIPPIQFSHFGLVYKRTINDNRMYEHSQCKVKIFLCISTMYCTLGRKKVKLHKFLILILH